MHFLYQFSTRVYIFALIQNYVYAHAIPATITSLSTSSTLTSSPSAPKFTLSNYNSALIAIANTDTDIQTSTLLPPLPLTGNTLNNVQSLLTLISSIPDTILSSNNESLSTFLTSLSTCLSDPIASLKNSLTSTLLPDLSSLIQDLESSLSENANQATSILGSIPTSLLPAVLPPASSALQNLESKVTAILPAITSQAHNIVDGAESLAQGAGSVLHDVATKVADAVPAAVTHATEAAKEVIGDVADGIEDLAKEVFGGGINIDIHLPFVRSVSPTRVLKRTAEIEDTLSRISDITACISNTLDANPGFQAGKCALELASLAVSVGRLRAVKTLVGVLGGDVRTVQRLGGVVQKGVDGDVDDDLGEQVLDLLRELSGIGDVVKACKFLVEE
ncbi:hypothetical protein BKA65DRAFT_474566 [Rhexocercosporidium sp. MPI-PUGE-AT-0058]|nr:hypothetical protein BKA65DRAFT_474566 [Rhexocercosporidium sp. MPI-PUGE-AT-0058]